MQKKHPIYDMVAPTIENMGFDVVRIMTIGQQNPTVQIMIERKDGENLVVDDCAAVSRAVSEILSYYNGTVYISARSIDELNVQVVMEKIGGGGHMSVAGAQLSDCTVFEAMEKVKDVLRDMTEKGEV